LVIAMFEVLQLVCNSSKRVVSAAPGMWLL
jgi:hypothetical protein